MNKNIGWVHPTDDSDQWDGFNEPGIEHFAGSPIRHLAREVNQNSCDSGVGQTVKVCMRHYSIETSSIPDIDELKATFSLCRAAAKNESEKAKQFFDIAASELAKSKISVLEISDFNTRGMRGPSSNGTPFYAFMKAKGQSRKDSSTATGSFGIGKFAPYAVSKLRTVFVSTVYVDDAGKYQQLTQGKSILMSHDKGVKRLQGAGFWGVKAKCQPVNGVHSELPNWLQRVSDDGGLTDNTGTKLIILGFDTASGWKENLAVSVAENFFGAINSGKLEVDIVGEYNLDSTSIGSFYASPKIRESIEKQKNEPDQFDNCASYLATLQGNAEVIKEESEVLHLGLCELRILLQEGLPKRVCALRNGMFISDALSLPGLKSFSDFKEFVAVVECKNKAGSELLRAMEPPRHDDFEPDRLPSKEEQAKGEKALKNLASWIRNMLKRHAKNPVSEVTTLDELKEYFADETGEGNGKGTEEVDPSGKIVIRAKPLKVKEPTFTTTENNNADSVNGDEADADETGGGGADGGSSGDGVGGVGDGVGGAASTGTGTQPRKSVDLNNIRAVAIDGKSRRISFTPTHNGEICVSVLEAGADSDYDISVSATSQGDIKGGKVYMKTTAKTRVSLDLVLGEDFAGALKVVAHEI